MEKNIIFCGVGGQGVILASKVLMETALRAGYDVKGIGSSRNGSARRKCRMLCTFRYKIYSPLIAKGKADYVVSLELWNHSEKLNSF